MKTAVVNFKTTPEIKKRAQINAKAAGIPLSLLLNRNLNEIANARHLTLDFDRAKPPQWISSDKNEQLRQDAQELARLKFEDLPSEDEWLSIQPSFN